MQNSIFFNKKKKKIKKILFFFLNFSKNRKKMGATGTKVL